MIIIKIIILYFIQVTHTDDIPSMGTRLVYSNTCRASHSRIDLAIFLHFCRSSLTHAVTVIPVALFHQTKRHIVCKRTRPPGHMAKPLKFPPTCNSQKPLIVSNQVPYLLLHSLVGNSGSSTYSHQHLSVALHFECDATEKVLLR